MDAPGLNAPAELATESYLRQRLDPQPGDEFYLHLADLRLALEGARAPAASCVLDYGCGGSPYRSLFPSAVYHGADLTGTPGVDFTFGSDTRLPVPDAEYDLVLSTQVLEHVRHPAAYLAECHRVLQPGGRLLLSTHGTFRDHDCPSDFHRWTADGLKDAVAAAGFAVTRIQKLTSGPRALMFLIGQHQNEMLTSDFSWPAFYLRFLRAPFRWRHAAIDQFCDRAFSKYRVSDASEAGRSLYVALLVTAVRPG